VKRVGFVVHPDREAAHYAADRLVGWLEERGIECRWYRDEAMDEPERDRAFAHDLDLDVSVGGDGTFLHAAHVASRGSSPVLGVKVGRLGFLTDVEPDEAIGVLQAVLSGSALIEERMAALAEPRGALSFEPQWALNEIIVEKKARHRLVRLALYVDDVYVTTFSADGGSWRRPPARPRTRSRAAVPSSRRRSLACS
jgi:NAD+ kinase